MRYHYSFVTTNSHLSEKAEYLEHIVNTFIPIDEYKSILLNADIVSYTYDKINDLLINNRNNPIDYKSYYEPYVEHEWSYLYDNTTTNVMLHLTLVDNNHKYIFDASSPLNIQIGFRIAKNEYTVDLYTSHDIPFEQYHNSIKEIENNIVKITKPIIHSKFIDDYYTYLQEPIENGL